LGWTGVEGVGGRGAGLTTGSGNSGSIDDEESYAEEEELADERDDLTEGASLIIYLEKKI
jgi:hypothetical protein